MAVQRRLYPQRDVDPVHVAEHLDVVLDVADPDQGGDHAAAARRWLPYRTAPVTVTSPSFAVASTSGGTVIAEDRRLFAAVVSSASSR
jgi:hypothetical protein